MSSSSRQPFPPPAGWRGILAYHVWPLLALATLAFAATAMAWHVGFEQRWTSDTTDTFYRIISTTPEHAARGGGLFETLLAELAGAFATQPATAWYQAAFDAYLRSFFLATGDISMAYKAVVFPLLLIFSCGAYGFFWVLTGRRSLALLLTVAALLPMPLSWAGERSGFGPIWNYTRRYFLTAWLPLLTWLVYRGTQGNDKRLLLAIAGAGLASNLHASGVLLLQIFVLAWLIMGPLSPRRMIKGLLLVAFGMAFSVTALGSLWANGLSKMLELIIAGLGGTAFADIAILPLSKAGIQEELQYLFYPPRIYKGLPQFVVDIWLLLTLAISILPLVIRRRHSAALPPALFAASALCLLFVSFDQMWPWVLLGVALYRAAAGMPSSPAFSFSCYLVIANFWVAVGGMLVLQAAFQAVEGFPLVFNQLRSIRFMGFWVIVWCAALAWPLLRHEQPIGRRTRAVVLAAALLCGFATAKEAYRHYSGRQDADYVAKKLALLDIAAWAKQNTPKQASFLAGSSAFAIVSERRVYRTDKEVRNQKLDWLPPKGGLPPNEAIAAAAREQLDYFFLVPGDISPPLAACIKTANGHYALLETACARAHAGQGPITATRPRDSAVGAVADDDAP